MGILSDFVVADAAEADAVGGTLDRRRWPLFQSSGFTVLEVAYLHFLLADEDPDAMASPPRSVRNPFTKREEPVLALADYISEFACLLDAGESWVHKLPDGLVGELASATNLTAIAERWASCDALVGAESATLIGVLAELQRLARLAQSSQKAVLLWTSL
jgi:hypothetical protein